MRADDIRKTTEAGLDELIAAVQAGKSEGLREYLAQMAKFHRYSVTNHFLILAQHPQATRVAGYRTWKKLGRQVRRGSKSIRILAPILKRKTDEGRDEEALAGFRTIGVFDISQTDGKSLANFTRPQGDPGPHIDRLKQFVAAQGIRLKHSDSLGGAEGISRGGEIILRMGLTPAEEFSVLAHELAHELLHRSPGQNRLVRETEAEATAFVVCQAVGLDAKDAASDYIQLYRGDKETLLASLQRIRRTANLILRAVLSEEREAAA